MLPNRERNRKEVLGEANGLENTKIKVAGNQDRKSNPEGGGRGASCVYCAVSEPGASGTTACRTESSSPPRADSSAATAVMSGTANDETELYDNRYELVGSSVRKVEGDILNGSGQHRLLSSLEDAEPARGSPDASGLYPHGRLERRNEPDTIVAAEHGPARRHPAPVVGPILICVAVRD